MILWVNRGTTYDVYELTQARNKMTESDEEFIGRIMQVLNVQIKYIICFQILKYWTENVRKFELIYFNG